MSVALPVSSTPTPPYDSAYDVANPGISLPKFGNDLYDDCVIAARAHHTIRLNYAAGRPSILITDPEVTEEFNIETDRQGTTGLDLGMSLGEWKNPGWKAGGSGGRAIVNFWGPYDFVLAGSSASYPMNEMNETQVMTAIVQYTGAQSQLLLPEWIDPSSPRTFGNGTLWSDTSGGQFSPHAMLLTGFDQNGPIGVTWGAKQHMTWKFLSAYCTGLFVVE